MSSILQDEKSWLRQYSTEDLTRTLVRQYLYQHNMFKTLNCFEAEDKENSKKIIKSTLIKMLCINNLVVSNKKIDKNKQCKSFLILLVQYLRGKFEERIAKEDGYQQKSQQPQKDFSMNGDKLLTSVMKDGNRIKQKNLVDTKRKQLDEKTLTQDAFYKKKDLNKQQEQTFAKKSTNAIKQDKKQAQFRPSTANPLLQPKKQQQKVSLIYSKLNTHVREGKISSMEDEYDPMQVKLNHLSQNKNEKLLNKKETEKQNTNNRAIGKNSKMQSSSNTKELRQLKKVEQKSFHQLPIQSNIDDRYSQEKQKQSKSKRLVQQSYPILSGNSNAIEPKPEKKQLVEEYYDEFEEQRMEQQIQIIQQSQKLQQQMTNKIDIQEIPAPRKFIQIKVQQDEAIKQPIAESFQPKKISNQIKQLKKTQIQIKNVDPPTKQAQKTVVEDQFSYKPTGSASRGGMKLLRKVPNEFTKQENATEMIGKEIKLLPDNIKNGEQKISQFEQLSKTTLIDSKQQNLVPRQFMIANKQVQTKIQTGNKQPVINSQQITSSTNVRQLKLKKKVKNAQDEQPKLSGKFKFDENFVDQPLNGIKQKYLYENFSFDKMIIKPQLKPQNSNMILQAKINYTQKPNADSAGSNPYAQSSSKKKNEKPLSIQKGEQLKKIIFQKGNPYLPKAWHQGFILSPFAQTLYGLKQIQGGPCGIIAAAQCFFLKHLMYLSKPTCENDIKNQIRRQNCLIAALTDILWKAKGMSDKIILIIPTNRNFSGAKLQFSSLTEVQIQATSFESCYQSMWNYKSSFIGQSNHGVTAIIYSIVMTKGIQKIYNEVDMRQNPLIGHHGHCTQELVNLFISGQSASNCFDGKKQLEDNFTLHGINQKAEFGFLTVFQTLGYIEVGKNLKNPLFPIWIISKQFHYHVIFGNHYLIGQNNDCQKFDLIYFDGLYTCDKFIKLTFDQVEKDQFGMVKDMGNIKNLPLIEQVLLKKWGRRKVDWNGSIKIL